MNHLKILREKIKIFLAQTALHLEGIHLTEVQTKDLLNENNYNYFNVDEEDAIIIHNVIEALNYIENVDINNQPINIELYIKLNKILAHEQSLETGHLRTKPVAIACIPDNITPCKEEDIVKEIEKIANVDKSNFREVIPDVFCKLARMQPFYDGNKRSTTFLCNIALLKKNLGLLIINIENLQTFESLLTDYYTEKNKDILTFMGNELIFSTEQISQEIKNIISNKITGGTLRSKSVDSDEIIKKCFDNPLFLQEIPFKDQTEKIIQAALDGCRNCPGVNPSDLLEYADERFANIITNFPGQWMPTPPNNDLVWSE